MTLGKVLNEIQDDLLSGDFDAEMKYAIHFLKIESLEKASPEKMKRHLEDNKNLTDVYNKLAELSTPSELAEMINALSYRLAFYMALSQKLEVWHRTSQRIVDKLAPFVSRETERENDPPCLRKILDIREAKFSVS